MSLKNTLYAKYIYEREGAQIIENENGFITYKIINGECVVLDICVEKQSRGQGVFKKLFVELYSSAVKSGCEYITAKVYIKDPNHHTTLIAAFSVGGRLVGGNSEFVVLALKLGG